MLNLPLRGALFAGVCSAALLSGGCATVKRLNPWSASDEADTSTGTSTHLPETTTSSSARTATGSSSSAKPAAAAKAEDARLDLSLPASSLPAGAAAVIKPSAESAPIARGDIRENDASGWSAAIQAAIHRNWLRPRGPQIPSDFSCDVLVALTRSGIVEEAKIARSCGHAALDASVISAVQAASPLPLPADMGEFSDALLITFTPR